MSGNTLDLPPLCIFQDIIVEVVQSRGYSDFVVPACVILGEENNVNSSVILLQTKEKRARD
jgi:hypothetical protein